jgi:hypothetical protein
MSLKASLANDNSMDNSVVPIQWIGRDGIPLECQEKIALLNENLSEIQERCQQAFTEALQAGCSEEFMRIVLQNMIASLKRQTERPFNC